MASSKSDRADTRTSWPPWIFSGSSALTFFKILCGSRRIIRGIVRLDKHKWISQGRRVEGRLCRIGYVLVSGVSVKDSFRRFVLS